MTTDIEMTKTPETGASPEVAYEGPTHEDLKGCVEEFLSATDDARRLAERCRDYYDGKQWTEEQIRALKRRKQAPIVNNRIKVKHNGLLGLTSVRKADPKAFPRNQEADEGAAAAATDGLRYAADKVAFNSTMLDAADNFFCEGYCGVHIVEEYTPRGDVDIVVENIPWDRIFFDQHSQKKDFSDARGKGFMLWMDEEDILEAFPEASEDALNVQGLATDETFEDKPQWFKKSGKRTRHLVATHYFKHKGKWCVAVYTGAGFLQEPMPSPYVDEYGAPECPLEFQHAYIDRENNRYGELVSFLDLQDEINHRRSKALFLLSQRQTFGNRGAIKDMKKAKAELAKPDGHLEIGTGEFNKDFGILPTGDMAAGQFELLQEAKQEIDAQSYNAQLAGERGSGDLSGKAIGKLQQAGITELNMLFEGFSFFRLRVYRQMWHRMRQFWDKEKWVRVTDDEKKLKWVGFNVPVTMREALQDIMDDDTKPQAMRLGASAQMIMLERQNPQGLEEIIEVKNRPSELDMDIILDESYDVVNASQEQLDAILNFGAQGQFDIIDLLEISNITGKDKLIDKIEGRRKEAAEAQAQAAQADPNIQLIGAKVADTAAAAEIKKQDAIQKALETDILMNQPVGSIPFKGQVSI